MDENLNAEEQEKGISDFVDEYNRIAQHLLTDEDLEKRPPAHGIFSPSRETFARIQKLLKEKFERQEDERLLSQTLPRMEEGLQNIIIDDFIDEYFAGTSIGDKVVLKRYIKSVLQERESVDDWRFRVTFEMESEQTEALKALLVGGVPFARAGLKTKKDKTPKQLPWKYVWSVAQNLIALIIAVAIFGVATDNFQSIILAVLVMIYLAVKGIGMGLGTMWKTIPAYLEAGSDEEKQKKITKMMAEQLPTLWIDMVFLSLIWIVAIWHLLIAL